MYVARLTRLLVSACLILTMSADATVEPRPGLVPASPSVPAGPPPLSVTMPVLTLNPFENSIETGGGNLYSLPMPFENSFENLTGGGNLYSLPMPFENSFENLTGGGNLYSLPVPFENSFEDFGSGGSPFLDFTIGPMIGPSLSLTPAKPNTGQGKDIPPRGPINPRDTGGAQVKGSRAVPK
jgi:hypothetical protein